MRSKPSSRSSYRIGRTHSGRKERSLLYCDWRGKISSILGPDSCALGWLLEYNKHLEAYEIQTSIMVQRNAARELALAKRREKRQATRTINDNDTGTPILSDLVPEPSEENGPQYCTRRNALVEGSSGDGSGKENEGPRRSKRN